MATTPARVRSRIRNRTPRETQIRGITATMKHVATTTSCARCTQFGPSRAKSTHAAKVTTRQVSVSQNNAAPPTAPHVIMVHASLRVDVIGTRTSRVPAASCRRICRRRRRSTTCCGTHIGNATRAGSQGCSSRMSASNRNMPWPILNSRHATNTESPSSLVTEAPDKPIVQRTFPMPQVSPNSLPRSITSHRGNWNGGRDREGEPSGEPHARASRSRTARQEPRPSNASPYSRIHHHPVERRAVRPYAQKRGVAVYAPTAARSRHVTSSKHHQREPTWRLE